MEEQLELLEGISKETTNELSLFLINSNLDKKQKDDLLQIIFSLVNTNIKS